MQSKISKGKRYIGRSPEEIRHNLPTVITQWSHIGCTNFSSKKLWQCMWSVIYQRSSIETKCQSFLLETGHTGNVCLALIKSQSPRKKICVQNRSHCLYKQSRHSEPLFIMESSVSVQGTVYHSSSQTTVKSQPCKEAFLRWSFSQFVKDSKYE